MFWNKKDGKSMLPDLPPLDPRAFNREVSQELQSPSDEFPTEKHSLPSFPNCPRNSEVPQKTIKNAVKTSEIRELEEPETQIEEDYSMPPSQSQMPQIEMPEMQNLSVQKNEKFSNVFVKLDKFNSARKSLAFAQEKISEIDSMLKKIREARMREEQELSSWEKEVENAKMHIEGASKSLFDKLS